MKHVLETERLYLREFTEDDAALIFSLNSDPEVVKYIHEQPLRDEEDALEVICSVILPQYRFQLGRWAVYTKDDHEFIGWCGLKFQPENDIVDLGYGLMRSAWGQGFATEAAKACIEYGFDQLSLPVITGRSHIENFASIHVLEKLGMKFSCNEMVDNCPVKTYTILNPSVK